MTQADASDVFVRDYTWQVLCDEKLVQWICDFCNCMKCFMNWRILVGYSVGSYCWCCSVCYIYSVLTWLTMHCRHTWLHELQTVLWHNVCYCNNLVSSCVSDVETVVWLNFAGTCCRRCLLNFLIIMFHKLEQSEAVFCGGWFSVKFMTEVGTVNCRVHAILRLLSKLLWSYSYLHHASVWLCAACTGHSVIYVYSLFCVI